jgi:isoleucyl-tRNA synthetase
VAASLKVVSLARSARTASKLKVRQPLAEMIVAPYDDTERAAVEKFDSHLREELNVKKITVRDSVADMCTIEVSLNKKLAGPKYGKQLSAVAAALEAADHVAVAARVEDGFSVELRVADRTMHLEAAEIKVTRSYGQDWVAAADSGTVVLLDKRITDDLRKEGIARDVVRFVQVARKDAGLELEDRIVLSLRSESDLLKAAVCAYDAYIAAETLATEITDASLDDPMGSSEVNVAGQPLHIELRRA